MRKGSRVTRLDGRTVVVVCGVIHTVSGGAMTAQERDDSVYDNPSVLRYLPVTDTIWPTADGVTREDTIHVTHPLVRAGRRVAAWSMEAERGESYEIRVQSTDFDAYLYVVGRGIASLMDGSYAITNDDGGEGVDSRLCFQAPESDHYTVVAAALYGEVGGYSLFVRAGCLDDSQDLGEQEAVEGNVEQGSGSPEGAAGFDFWEDVEVTDTIRLGMVSHGVFSENTGVDYDGRPIVGWALPVRGGQRLSIELVGDKVDVLLHVLSPHDFRGGFGSNVDVPFGHISDDDSRGALDAQLCVLVPDDIAEAVYRVVASSATEGAVGEYGIIVMEDPNGLLCPTMRTAAEQYRDLMMNLPAAGRVARLGEYVEGVLTHGESIDPVHGTAVQPWFLEGVKPGDSIIVALRSVAVEADVMIRADTDDIEVESDWCFDVMKLTLPEQGDDYRLFVGPRYESDTGPYSLGVFRQSEWEDFGSCDDLQEERLWAELTRVGRPLEVGYEMKGELGSAEVGGVWVVEIREAETVVVAVESEDFDPLLEVYNRELDFLGTDDDGGVGTSARLELTELQQGMYYIIVRDIGLGFDSGAGEYRVRVLRTGYREGVPGSG